MITRIELENFKRFDKFVIKAASGNILVGPNNSGKSSILDALRILDACYRYSKTKKPQPIQVDTGYSDGYIIPSNYLPISMDYVARNYDENDAVIKIKHENGAVAVIRLNPDRQTKFYIDSEGRRFSSSEKFRAAFPVSFVIVPTLAPLEAKEVYVTDETVAKNRSTRLAARSFRNIWYRESDDDFKVFKSRVERAWPGIELVKPRLIVDKHNWLEMNFEENRIPREIHWAGFGFQIWLQIHTHLLRASQNSILVLDEPDVYLHPDLQHKLYHDISSLFSQYFVATHAPEIINEAETREILVINHGSMSATRIKNEADYDKMLTFLGSAENADFAKIARVKKVIFVEGQDFKLIKKLAKILGLDRLSSDITAPVFQLGGFSQWRRAKETVWAFKNLLDVEIETICLFDRDYRCDDEVTAFIHDMEKDGMKCFVLKKKEIENYLISDVFITRIANLKRHGELPPIERDCVGDLISEACEEMKDDTDSQLISNYLRHHKRINSKSDDSNLIKAANKIINAAWKSLDGKTKISSGKELLGKVLHLLKSKFGVSLTPSSLATAIRADEIPDELRDILVQLDDFLAK
ncbi:MAG: hypothetical protein FD163_1400 [Hyphomonadaceae bacterium]|nr:MAG: hypothetical protein FD128_488 [Hyphomonadaceae bacterium]KAF0184703.1 MAG: hypothetical protein FD163_1400 [Hyphomonadaceae bacterium]